MNDKDIYHKRDPFSVCPPERKRRLTSEGNLVAKKVN